MTHLDNIYQLPILIGSTLVLYYSVNPKVLAELYM